MVNRVKYAAHCQDCNWSSEVLEEADANAKGLEHAKEHANMSEPKGVMLNSEDGTITGPVGL